MKRIRKEDMVAGPYNPDRTPSFGDNIVADLGARLRKGQLSPVVYSFAIDLTRRIEKQLTGIYSRGRHGLRAATQLVIAQSCKRLS